MRLVRFSSSPSARALQFLRLALAITAYLSLAASIVTIIFWFLNKKPPGLETVQLEPLAALFGAFFPILLRLSADLKQRIEIGDATAQVFEQRYLEQVKGRIEELQAPLLESPDEIVPLHAEFIKPTYQILSRAQNPRDTRQKKRVTEDLVKTLLKAKLPLVVLGDPGAGKSVALRSVALSVVEMGMRKSRPLLPVYLSLGAYRDEIDKENLQASAIKFIKGSMQKHGGAGLKVLEHFDEYLHAGRFVFLLDALDEMPQSAIEDRFNALASLKGFTGNKLLFACRKLNFLELESFTFERALIQPFNANQIREFLERSITSTELAQRAIHDVLSTSNHLQDLAGNPFFLKLFAVFYQDRQKLPESRADLMAEYEARVAKRAAGKTPDKQLSPPLNEKRFRAVLARLGYMISVARRGVFIETEAFKRQFMPTDLNERSLLEECDESVIDSTLMVAKNEGLLLVEKMLPDDSPAEKEFIKFYHHRMEEYYAALYLDDFEPRLNWQEHIDDIWWQEVLIMLFGIASEPKTREYTSMILGALPGTPIVCADLGPALANAVLVKDLKSEAELRQLDASGFYGLKDLTSEPRNVREALEAAGVLKRPAQQSQEPKESETAKETEKFTAFMDMKAVPGRDMQVDHTRRWLELHNRRLLDRSELAAECFRNAADRIPVAVIQRLSGLLSKLIKYGNSWEIVRSINIVLRLPDIDHYSITKPAMYHGSSWIRGEAIEAITKYKIGSQTSLSHVAVILFLQFCKGEILTSISHFSRALRQRRALWRFVPGLLLLCLLSAASVVAPLFLYKFFFWVFPEGFIYLDGKLGFSANTWVFVVAILIVIAIYAARLSADISIADSTLFVSCVVVSHSVIISAAKSISIFPSELKTFTWLGFVSDIWLSIKFVLLSLLLCFGIAFIEWLAIFVLALVCCIVFRSWAIVRLMNPILFVEILVEDRKLLKATLTEIPPFILSTFGPVYFFGFTLMFFTGVVITIGVKRILFAIGIIILGLLILKLVFRISEFGMRESLDAVWGSLSSMLQFISRGLRAVGPTLRSTAERITNISLTGLANSIQAWLRALLRELASGCRQLWLAARYIVTSTSSFAWWGRLCVYLMIVLVPLYYLTPFSVVIDYLFVVVRRLFVWFARNPGVLLVLSIVLILGVWFIVALREQLNRVVLFVGWESLLYVRLRRQQVVLDEEAFWKRISTLKEYDVIRMVEQRVKNSAAAERLESYRKALCYVNNDWAQTYLFKKIDQVHREQRHKEMNAG